MLQTTLLNIGPNRGKEAGKGLRDGGSGYLSVVKTKPLVVEGDVQFAAALDLDLPDLGDAVGWTAPVGEERLWTTYFDTSDFRLWRSGLTLSNRRGEGSEEGTWTLKLPEAPAAAGFERSEVSWPGSVETIPGEAAALLCGLVRRSALVQVAELLTLRRRLVLHGSDGSTLGGLDDDIVTVSGGSRDGFRFRQLELDVVAGDPGTAEAVFASLHDAGARVSDAPMLAVALGLSAGLAPDTKPTEIGKGAAFGDLVTAALTDGLERLLAHDYRMRLDGPGVDPHDVHQARVATRRLRSNLKLFEPVLDPVWVAHTRAELRWLGEILGRVRDCDVMAEHLVAGPQWSGEESEGLDRLRSSLTAERRAAARELMTVLATDRYLDLLGRLHAGIQMAPFFPHGDAAASRVWISGDPAKRALPGLVELEWRALHRKLQKIGDHPSDRELHKTRIRAKRLRYAAEAAAPVLGRPARRTAKAAEELQTVLGEHHDAVNLEQWLRLHAIKGSRQTSFVAGELTAEQRRRQDEIRHHWRSVAKRVNDAKL